VEVAESLSEVDGRLIFGPTKTHQARQTALPQALTDTLAAHIDKYVEEDREALVFTAPEGGPLRIPNFRRRVWWAALDETELSRAVRIHDLRHTCASLLIAQGAHPKAIQQHLGHSSISVTFDRYGHLFPDDQDRLAAALDEVIR
jgi:integrase